MTESQPEHMQDLVQAEQLDINTAAFNDIYYKYVLPAIEPVNEFISKRLKGLPKAEDHTETAMQAVLLRVWQHAPKTRDIIYEVRESKPERAILPLLKFMYNGARLACIDRLRSVGALDESTLLREMPPDIEYGSGTHGHPLADPDLPVGRQLLHRESWTEITSSLYEYAPRHRHIIDFALLRAKGYSANEAAGLTSISSAHYGTTRLKSLQPLFGMILRYAQVRSEHNDQPAGKQLEEIAGSESFKHTQAVVSAVRRVGSLFGLWDTAQLLNSEVYLRDIKSDLEEFQHIELTDAQIRRAAVSVSRIATLYVPFILEHHYDGASKQNPTKVFELLTEFVWFRSHTILSNNEPAVLAALMNRDLLHINRVAPQRIENAQNDTAERDNNGLPTEPGTELMLLKESLACFRASIEGIPLKTVIAAAGELPPRERSAVLYRFGYLMPGSTTLEYCAAIGIHVRTYWEAAIRGLSNLRELLTFPQENDWSTASMQSIISGAEYEPPRYSDGKLISYNDPLLKLIELEESGRLNLDRLPPRRQTILKAVLMKVDGRYQPQSIVAGQFGLKYGNIRSHIQKAAHDLTNTAIIYSTDGKKVTSGTTHDRVLRCNPRDGAVESLQDSDRELFEAIRARDPQTGRVPSTADLSARFGKHRTGLWDDADRIYTAVMNE